MVKKVNAIHTTDTSDLVKKADYNTKIDKTEKKIPNRDKYITTKEFDKITAEHFAGRLKQAKLATKDDEKLINVYKKVTLNKTRHVEVKKIDDLSEEVKLISTKVLTKDFINKSSVLDSGKCFSLDGSQNYLVSQPLSS